MDKTIDRKIESFRELKNSDLLLLSNQQTTSNDIYIIINDSSKDINTKFNTYKFIPMKKGKWSPEEDKLLADWVKKHGPKDWEECCRFIQGRKGKQCREHWNNCLNPALIKGKWTPEEDFLILFFYQKCKGSWKKIIPLFDGRIENSIKNRFYTQLRKYATKNMTPKNRKRLGMKIKLSELKKYIDEALIKAKADLLYESKMSEEEFNLFIDKNNRKIESNKLIESDNDNLEWNSSTNFDLNNDEELNQKLTNKKRFRKEDSSNINNNINMNGNYLPNHNSDESELGSEYLNNDISNDINSTNSLNNKDNNNIKDNIIFNNIGFNNNDEQSIDCLEYSDFKNNNSFIEMYIKDN